MSNVFHVPNLTNKPRRSGFDLSMKNSFSAKIGEILPIFHRTVGPGDKFRLKLQHRTVTTPLETSAFTRFTEYFDFFFVPYDQIYRPANMTLMQMQNNPQIALSPNSAQGIGTQLPYFLLYDFIGPYTSITPSTSYLRRLASRGSEVPLDHQGFNICYNMLKLANYMGLGWMPESYLTSSSYNLSTPTTPIYSNRPIGLAEFAAYQKIYFDHYRFDQWETNKPQCYNFDYLSNAGDPNPRFTLSMMNQMDVYDNPFVLRHCRYPKDLFFGMLPSPQYGDSATVSSYVYSDFNNDEQQTKRPFVMFNTVDGAPASHAAVGPEGAHMSDDETQSVNVAFSILDLRFGKQLQRYREIVGTGDQDYASMVKKVYGVDVPKYTSHLSQYLGGFSNTININSILNNNLNDASSQPNMKGFADGTDEQNGMITFNAKEHGIIMVLYRVVPMLDYALNAPHFDLLKTSVDDFANPFFDRLGLQELPAAYLTDQVRSSGASQTAFLGYVPRYFDYKTSIDVVNGNFRTNMKHWIAAFDQSYVDSWVTNSVAGIPVINKDFFKVNSHLVDDVFFQNSDQSVDSDQFLVNCNIECKAVRPYDFDGLPKGN